MNRIRNLWLDLYYGVINLVLWFPVIFRDRDWDYVFLLRIMEFKFRRMRELHMKYGHCTNSPRKAHELLIVAELCRRIGEDEYSHYNPFTSEFDYRQPDKMANADLELLTKIMRTHLRTWWD
jgi:hypothetical protein